MLKLENSKPTMKMLRKRKSSTTRHTSTKRQYEAPLYPIQAEDKLRSQNRGSVMRVVLRISALRKEPKNSARKKNSDPSLCSHAVQDTHETIKSEQRDHVNTTAVVRPLPCRIAGVLWPCVHLARFQSRSGSINWLVDMDSARC